MYFSGVANGAEYTQSLNALNLKTETWSNIKPLSQLGILDFGISVEQDLVALITM